MNDLKIKGTTDQTFKDGYDYYHVRMGQGFIDVLENGVQLKEHIENDSRLEHGVRMLVTTKVDKRTISLKFNIHGATKAAYMTNKRAFETMLLQGMVTIKVNDSNHPDYYHLVYTGKSVSYNHSYNGRFGIFTAQFIEPNPNNRTSTANPYVRII